MIEDPIKMDVFLFRGSLIYGSPHIFDGNHPWELMGYNLNRLHGWGVTIEGFSTIIVDHSE